MRIRGRPPARAPRIGRGVRGRGRAEAAMRVARRGSRLRRILRGEWIAGVVELCIGVLGAVAWLAVIAGVDRDALRIP